MSGGNGLRDYRYAWANGWRWAGWYVRRRKWLAAGRQLCLSYIQGHIGEACQDCGRRYLLWFSPDDLYGRVTDRWPTPWNDGTDRAESAGGMFCPACFDKRAQARGLILRWVPVEPGRECLGVPGLPLRRIHLGERE